MRRAGDLLSKGIASRKAALVVSALVCLVLGTQAVCAQDYVIQDLGSLGGDWTGATGINNLGQAVGEARTAAGYYHAFLWTAGGGVRDLGTLVGGSNSSACAISDAGQVAGYASTAAWDTHAFLWTAAGGMQDLGTLGGRYSVATGINNTGINSPGQVVGYALRTDAGDWDCHAFLWTAEGGMQDLGTLGGRYSYAYGISDAGEVVGVATTAAGPGHAFLWTAGGGMQDLGTLGGSSSMAHAINNQGQVVGDSLTADDQGAHAFLWTAGGGMQDLGALGGDFSVSKALGINSLGQVVGVSYGPVGSRACLWRPVTPVEQVEGLAASVADLNLPQQVSNNLDPKLQSAMNALADGNAQNDVVAINALNAFINAVSAQRGKKISEADADALIEQALHIIASLGG